MNKNFRNILLFFALTGSLNSFGQDFTLVAKIKSNADYFTTDPLGNIYTVERVEIKKFNSSGELLNTYSDKSRGAVFALDALNPMKILVFYKDFRQIVFLSSNLSINGDPILLDDLGIMQPALACTSYDNNFWVYDSQNMNLSRYDINLQVSAQSGNISLLNDFGTNLLKPNYIEEQSGKVYLNIPGTGILEFDKFGTYSKAIPVDSISSFQPFDNALWYIKNDTLNKYTFKSFETAKLAIPIKNVMKIRICSGMLYLQTNSDICIYKI